MLTSLADGYRRHRFAWLFGSLILTSAASPALHAIVPRVNAVELLLAINLVAVVSTVTRRENGMGWMLLTVWYMHMGNASKGRKSMNRRIGQWIRVSSLALMAAGLLVSPAPAAGEDRPADRQDARDTRQTGRDASRDAKAACREGDEKSRPECRQEKRGTKQDSRDAAHDIKTTD
jgi:hypothetical protein